GRIDHLDLRYESALQDSQRRGGEWRDDGFDRSRDFRRDAVCEFGIRRSGGTARECVAGVPCGMNQPTEPVNLYGDRLIRTTGSHGADIASQRLDELDREALHHNLALPDPGVTCLDL